MVLGLGFEAVSGGMTFDGEMIEGGDFGPILLPLLIASGGVVCSIVGTLLVTRNMHWTWVHLALRA